MLLMTGTSDLVQIVTAQAADIEVHASWLDVTGTPQVVTPGRTNTASITTATTTTVVGSPAASTQRNVKRINITNNHASVACAVEVIHTDGTNPVEIIGVNLLPGENLILDATGAWHHRDANGGEYINTLDATTRRNSINAALTPGAGASTYLAGSQILIPAGGLKLGATFYWRVQMTKTAAGTAATSWIVRIGTAGAVGDAAILTFAWPVGTAAIDFGYIDIFAVVRGPLGAACIMFGHTFTHHNLATTGLINVQQQNLAVTSGAFQSGTTGLIVGLSVTTGASVALTIAHCEVVGEGL